MGMRIFAYFCSFVKMAQLPQCRLETVRLTLFLRENLLEKMEFVYGLGMGVVISLCFSFGPAFFTLLHTSVQYGFRKAVPIAFGISTDDVLIVGLLLTVLCKMDMEKVLHNPWVASIGFVMLLATGAYTFTRKAEEMEEPQSRVRFRPTTAVKPISIYLRGFFINFFNPAIWIFWLSIITLTSGKLNVTGQSLFPCFAGILLMTLSLDILKCKGASLLQRFLTAKRLTLFNKFIGLVLAGCGVYLLVSMIVAQV